MSSRHILIKPHKYCRVPDRGKTIATSLFVRGLGSYRLRSLNTSHV